MMLVYNKKKHLTISTETYKGFGFAAAIFDKDLHVVIACWAIRINLPYKRKIKSINEL